MTVLLALLDGGCWFVGGGWLVVVDGWLLVVVGWLAWLLEADGHWGIPGHMVDIMMSEAHLTGVFTKTATQIWRCYRWEWVPTGQTIKPGGYASKPNILHIVVISQHFTSESLPVSALLNLPVQLRFCTPEQRF